MKKLIFVCWCCLLYAENTAARQVVEDSLHIDDVGKKDIRLRPEVLEAIKSGSLIRFSDGIKKQPFRTAPSVLPLSKELDLHVSEPECSGRKVDYKKIPPSVFMLYFNQPVESLKLQSFSLSGIENYKDDRPADPPLITDPTLKFPFFMISINNLIECFSSKKN